MTTRWHEIEESLRDDRVACSICNAAEADTTCDKCSCPVCPGCSTTDECSQTICSDCKEARKP